jgi:hypothetical protein
MDVTIDVDFHLGQRGGDGRWLGKQYEIRADL